MDFFGNFFSNPRRAITALFAAGCFNLVVFGYIFGFHPTSDTDSFVLAIDFFRGDSFSIFPNRYLNPLYPLMATSLFPFLTAPHSIVAINFLFYFGLIFLTFDLVRRVFRNTIIGGIAAMLFMTGYPLLRYGLLQVQDMGGYFWFVSTIYTAWRWQEDKDWRWLALGSICVAFGVLTKESGCMGALFAGLLIVVDRISWKRKIVLLAGFAVLPLLTIFINADRGGDVGYSSAKWFVENWYVYAPGNYNFVKWLGVNLTTHNLLWFFIIYGLFFLWKHRKEVDPNIKKYLLLIIPSSASYFAWPMFIGRTVFISAWFFLPIASFALFQIISHKKFRYLGYGLVLVAMLVPYVLQYTLAYAPLFPIVEHCRYNPVCSVGYFFEHRETFSTTGYYGFVPVE